MFKNSIFYSKLRFFIESKVFFSFELALTLIFLITIRRLQSLFFI